MKNREGGCKADRSGWVGRQVKSGLYLLFVAMVGWSVNVKFIRGQQEDMQLQHSHCLLKLALVEVGEDPCGNWEHCGAAKNGELVREEV